MPVSILVLTLNEEKNLPDCLASVSWTDDIVVLDSMSDDRTVDIARAGNAKVVQRKFDNWASHQNWAMSNLTFKHQWVFYLDADERMTPELASEINGISADSMEERVAFYCGRRNFFMGRWIRHAMPPGTIMRFFRPEKVRFERLVNPVPVIAGMHGYLKNDFLHFNFSKGLEEWFDKHNRYSTLEAMEGMALAKRERAGEPSLWSADPAIRRQAVKNLAFRLPMRPLLKFIYLCILKGGWLDGRPGLTYCVLQSVYEYMIVLKMRELRLREKGLGL